MKIEVKNLSFAYRSSLVLNNISTQINPGELVSILGPNGAGKTTFLKILGKIIPFFFGEVLLEGKSLKNFSQRALAQKISYVPQNFYIYFPMNCFQFILLGRLPFLKRFGFETKRDLEVAEEAMKLTQTLDFKDRPFNELSGGERQRVLMAKALAQDPQIMLLDETTSNLDINHQFEVLSLIKKIRKERGLTVIWVSHNINLVATFGERVILLKRGELFSDGPVGEILTEENIYHIYGARVFVDKNPFTGTPRLTFKGESSL